MKIATLLIMLVLTQAQATETYPEFAGERYPVEYWQLTLISRTDMTDLSMEYYSRTSCIKEGLRRIVKDMNSDPVKWGAEPQLGFVCEYVRG